MDSFPPNRSSLHHNDLVETDFNVRSAAKGVPERQYEFDIELYDEIIPEETKKNITSRAVVLILRKKQMQAEFWPRLTKEKVKNNWIKTDFSKVRLVASEKRDTNADYGFTTVG